MSFSLPFPRDSATGGGRRWPGTGDEPDREEIALSGWGPAGKGWSWATALLPASFASSMAGAGRFHPSPIGQVTLGLVLGDRSVVGGDYYGLNSVVFGS